MSSEIAAALIGLGGTIVLALIGQAVASIYFAGKLVEKVNGLQDWQRESDKTLKQLVSDVATIKGKEQLA